MLDILKNNDLVITNNKDIILKYLNDNKKLLNIKIMSLKEFKNNLFGTYDERAIYYLVNKYNYKYEVAKIYLDNINFIDELKSELEDKNLIIYNPLFMNSFKRLILIDEILDDYIKDKLDNIEIINVNTKINNYKHEVYKFNNILDEVTFVATKIRQLLDSVSINKIFLVNVSSEYENIIRRIFDFYKIPINLNEKKSIFGNVQVKKFIEKLKNNKNVEESLKDLPKNDIYNAIVDVCNKYSFKEIDDTIIYLITEELKKIKINNTKLDNAINVIEIDDINSDFEYYFVLGFNQGILPKVLKDEDFLSDLKKKEYKILTSMDKNIFEKEKVINKITNFKNIFLSYKLKSGALEYYKSSLIDELGLLEKEETITYNYSDIYNKIILSKRLDNLIKFNEISPDLSLLYNNYKDINYLKYNNEYKKIDNNLLLKYLDNNLLLSYSSLDNYYRCSFRYYINNILKLNKYEETFMTYIGNLFHDILSKAFLPNFNFEEEFNNYINDKKHTNKELFFINKLKQDLIYTIDVIKKQDNYNSLDNALYEQKIFVNKDKNIKITFMGIIDKLKYKNIDNKNILAIIDYKTGNPEIDINNSYYGISMQLPIYLYLSKHLDLENVEIAGFYLQKVIHSKLNYQENKDYFKELEKLYRLEGYSNSNTDILNKFDNSYDNSEVIKGMKTSKNGFYNYTKVLNSDQIDKLINIVDEKIDNAVDNILSGDFSINPKKIGKELKGCEFCKFKDICHMKEDDIILLEEKKYQDFLGGEENA